MWGLVVALDFLDEILARAVSLITGEHLGFMAMDLDSRSVMDGMHRAS